jgi:hypothetical protein
MWGIRGKLFASLGVLIAGATLVGGVALAQTPTPTPAPGQGQTQQGNALSSFFLDKLAASLNVSRSQLDSAIKSAGGSTVDEALRQGNINQAQADRIKERINQGNGFFGGFFGRDGHKGGQGPNGGSARAPLGGILKAVADQLHMDQQTLMSQLRSGKTLKDIAAGATPPLTDLNSLKPGIKSALQTELQGKGVGQDRITQMLQRIDGLDLNQFGQGQLGPRGNRN